jgi:hypothetical protein
MSKTFIKDDDRLGIFNQSREYCIDEQSGFAHHSNKDAILAYLEKEKGRV